MMMLTSGRLIAGGRVPFRSDVSPERLQQVILGARSGWTVPLSEEVDQSVWSGGCPNPAQVQGSVEWKGCTFAVADRSLYQVVIIGGSPTKRNPGFPQRSTSIEHGWASRPPRPIGQ